VEHDTVAVLQGRIWVSTKPANQIRRAPMLQAGGGGISMRMASLTRDVGRRRGDQVPAIERACMSGLIGSRNYRVDLQASLRPSKLGAARAVLALHRGCHEGDWGVRCSIACGGGADRKLPRLQGFVTCATRTCSEPTETEPLHVYERQRVQNE